MNQPYARVNQPYATLTLASAVREMFGVQLYKNNARALLSRILSILNLDWLQHARSVRGVYESPIKTIHETLTGPIKDCTQNTDTYRHSEICLNLNFHHWYNCHQWDFGVIAPKSNPSASVSELIVIGETLVYRAKVESKCERKREWIGGSPLVHIKYEL